MTHWHDDPGSASAPPWSGRAGRYGIARRSCSRGPTSTRCRCAGAIALMIPPDAWVAEHPDDVLDGLDGLVLAGGADIDPRSYGDPRHPKTTNTRPDRDHAEIALALRALERDLPVLGICRGMQLINVALGGTLVQHLPDDVGHTDHRRALGSFDNADHDVRLQPGSLAARACGEIRARDEVPPSPGGRRARRGRRGDRLERARRPRRGDRGARLALGAGRPVAPGGRPALARRARVRGRSRPRPRRPRTGGGEAASHTSRP